MDGGGHQCADAGSKAVLRGSLSVGKAISFAANGTGHGNLELSWRVVCVNGFLVKAFIDAYRGIPQEKKKALPTVGKAILRGQWFHLCCTLCIHSWGDARVSARNCFSRASQGEKKFNKQARTNSNFVSMGVLTSCITTFED